MDASPSSCTVFKTPSPRELEIAPLLVERYSDKDIAQMLEIGVSTVQTHMKRMRKKCALHDRRDVGRWALAQVQPSGVYPMIGDTGPLDSPVP
jgi:DNA-binding NarL/FixJ family response regulator